MRWDGKVNDFGWLALKLHNIAAGRTPRLHEGERAISLGKKMRRVRGKVAVRLEEQVNRQYITIFVGAHTIRPTHSQAVPH